MNHLSPAFSQVIDRLPVDIRKTVHLVSAKETKHADKITYGRSPITAWIAYLAVWKEEFEVDPSLWALAIEVTKRLLVQQAHYESASAAGRRMGMRDALRSARRWIAVASEDVMYSDPYLLHDSVIEGAVLLASADGRPRRDRRVYTTRYTRGEVERIVDLAEGQPVRVDDLGAPSKRKRIFFGDQDDDEWDAKSAYDSSDPTLVACIDFVAELEHCRQSDAQLDQADLLWRLVTALGVWYAIQPRDTQSVRINVSGGPISIWPQEQVVRMHINNGYYDSAKCWRKADAILPMHPTLGWLIEKLNLTRSVGHLVDLLNFKPATIEDWRERQAKLIRVYHVLAPLEPAASLHRAHRHVSLFTLDTPLPLVCLFEGRPQFGARGPCSYLVTTNGELDAHFRSYVSQLHEYARLSAPELPDVREPEMPLGAVAPTYEDFLQKTLRLVDDADSHNTVIACYQRFCAALGMRRTRDPVSLTLYIRQHRVLRLEVSDKIVGDEAPARILPITPGIAQLLGAITEVFGDQPILPFALAETAIDSSQLTIEDRRRFREILFDGGDAKQPGRTAYIDQMHRDGWDERAILLAAGHAPTRGWWDWQRPERLGELVTIQSAKLTEFFLRHGVDDIAKTLASKIRSHCLPLRNTPIESKRLARFFPPAYRERRMPIGISRDADAFAAAFIAAEPNLKVPSKQEAQSACLCMLLATRGIPVANLHKYRQYYTLEHFVTDRLSGTLYFLVLLADSDAGGMSPYFLPIGQINNSADPLVQLLERCRHVEANGHPLRSSQWHYADYCTEKDILRWAQKVTRLDESVIAVRYKEWCAYECRWRLPGYFAGQLIRGSVRIANHIDYRDVFAYRGQTVDLVHSHSREPFAMPLSAKPLGAIDLPAFRIEQLKQIQRDGLVLIKGAQNQPGLWDLLDRIYVPQDHIVSRDTVIRHLEKAHFPEPLAKRRAREYIERNFALGLARMSHPLRLPTCEHLSAFIVRMRDSAKKVKPKNNDNSIEIDAKANRENTGFILMTLALGLVVCAVRSEEMERALALGYAELTPQARGILTAGCGLILGVEIAKSPAGKRVIYADLVCPPALRCHIDELSSRVTQLKGAHVKIKRDTLVNATPSAFGSKGYSPHNIRHAAIAWYLRDLIDHPRANNVQRLHVHTRQIGHVSDVTTFCSYIGTALY